MLAITGSNYVSILDAKSSKLLKRYCFLTRRAISLRWSNDDYYLAGIDRIPNSENYALYIWESSTLILLHTFVDSKLWHAEPFYFVGSSLIYYGQNKFDISCPRNLLLEQALLLYIFIEYRYDRLNKTSKRYYETISTLFNDGQSQHLTEYYNNFSERIRNSLSNLVDFSMFSKSMES